MINNLKTKNNSLKDKNIPSLTFFQKLKMLISSPNNFFDIIFKSEHSLKPSIRFYLIIQAVVFFIGLLPFLFLNPGSVVWSFFLYIISFLIGIALFFLILLVYHLVVRLWGGANGYFRTFQAFIYGMAPALLLGWLPLINILMVFYSIYLTITGLVKLHQMPKSRAIAAYFTPVIITFLLVILFAVTGLIISF